MIIVEVDERDVKDLAKYINSYYYGYKKPIEKNIFTPEALKEILKDLNSKHKTEVVDINVDWLINVDWFTTVWLEYGKDCLYSFEDLLEHFPSYVKIRKSGLVDVLSLIKITNVISLPNGNLLVKNPNFK